MFRTLYTSSSYQTKLSIVGGIIMVLFYLYASSVVHEPTRKSLLFGQVTIGLVLALYLILYKYLYPILFTSVDWTNSIFAPFEHPLRFLFRTFSVCVLCVHPIGRGVVTALPPTSEPYPLLMIIFACFGSFCILFTLSVLSDTLLRLYWFFSYLFIGRRTALANQIVSAHHRTKDTPSSSNTGTPSSHSSSIDQSSITGTVTSTAVVPTGSGLLKHRGGGGGGGGGGATGVPSTSFSSSSSSSSAAAGIADAKPVVPFTDTLTSLYSILQSTKRPPGITVTIFFFTIFISVYSLFEAQSDPRIVYVEVPLLRLPADLDGFRIVQLSDVHVGPTVGATRLQRIVNLANTLDGDINVLTGDFLDGDEVTYRPSIQPLRWLQSRTGKTYFVSGNHEYYDGHFSKKMFILRELGIRILYNERIAVPEYNDETYPYPRTLHTDYCKTCSSTVPKFSTATSPALPITNKDSGTTSSSPHKAEEVFDSSASRVMDQVREIIDATTGIALSHVSSEVPLIIDQKEEENFVIGQEGKPIVNNEYNEKSTGIQVSPDVSTMYSTFDLAGIPDYAASILAGITHKDNVTLALQNRDVTRELVLLAHQPKHIHETSIHGVGLQISGHVHGGQMVPLQLPVYLANPYFASLYKHESFIPDHPILQQTVEQLEGKCTMQKKEDPVAGTSSSSSSSLFSSIQNWWPTYIYVSRGTLYWGPPMRMGSKHEITCITLRSTAVVGKNFEGITRSSDENSDGYGWSIF